jgi:hypothetical protein
MPAEAGVHCRSILSQLLQISGHSHDEFKYPLVDGTIGIELASNDIWRIKNEETQKFEPVQIRRFNCCVV